MINSLGRGFTRRFYAYFMIVTICFGKKDGALTGSGGPRHPVHPGNRLVTDEYEEAIHAFCTVHNQQTYSLLIRYLPIAG